MEKNELIISPKTKVLQLIEAYPQLEDVLIRYVPAFEKLKNPVLRKTVAKIATLQQAAAIGGVKVEELINTLRKEVGQELYKGDGFVEYTTQKPEWFDASMVVKETDIRKMLNEGEQPVNLVIADLTALQKGEIYTVIAPFLPAPLIDKASSLGIKHWIEEKSNELFNVHFYKP